MHGARRGPAAADAPATVTSSRQCGGKTLAGPMRLVAARLQAPVPWEEIEQMSLCTPRGSWLDDDGSDVISEPDSAGRITIVTNELSPQPSKAVRSPLLFTTAPSRSSLAHLPCLLPRSSAQARVSHRRAPLRAGGAELGRIRDAALPPVSRAGASRRRRRAGPFWPSLLDPERAIFSAVRCGGCRCPAPCLHVALATPSRLLTTRPCYQRRSR